jgi:PEGA domain-containing protein
VNPKRIASFGLTLVPAAALTLWPVEAAAQHRGGYHGGSHVSIGVGVGFGYGHPFYAAPYFYNPYWWGAYGGFYGGFWGYPYFAYPGYYGYPGYVYDTSADLRVQVTPRTAEVYVDGYLIGTVDDFDGVFQRARMPLGEHEVTIYSPGFQSITQRMLFRPFESYKIKDTMRQLPAGQADEPRPAPAPRPPREQRYAPGPAGPPMGPAPNYRPPDGAPQAPRNPNRVEVEPGADRFGTIAVRVQPADAEVLIDGERWEASAGERILVHLSDGMHRVEVRKAGFVPYTSTVRVHSGETVTVNVSLSPQ